VLLLGILQNVLTLAEIPAFWIDAVYGAIILIALVVSWAAGGTAKETKARALRALGERTNHRPNLSC
jgi:ribose/xylose/arabinose/galactoside ABC-type transport system permease subunit